MTALLKKLHDRENGFTLIELLIVVLIIGVLAAIAIPVYLGIQNQGYKSAIKSDVNLTVKRVQVGVTEGAKMSTIRTNQSPYVQKSVTGEVVQIVAPTNGSAGADDFGVQGIVTKNSGGPINYGYFYDSVTGKFTESEDALALGSSASSIVITTASLPNGTVGSAYSATVNATSINPATPTQYTATGLPSNWTMDASTGTIAAPASAVTSPTTLSITVTATNGSATATKNYTVNVYDQARISTTTLPAARKGQFYDQTLTFSGNPAPAFTVSNGALPAGVTLDAASGRISGTPTGSGQANFTITATNAGGSDAKAYSIAINDAAAISTTSLPDATVGNAYNQTVSGSGYPAATYSATNLPSGLTMNSSTGAITGTSAALSGNSYAVTITADNGIGSAATKNITLVNNEAPNLVNAQLRNVQIGGSYTATAFNRLFYPGYSTAGTTFTITPGTGQYSNKSMIPGVSINSAGYAVGTTTTAGEFSYVITATNAAGTASQEYMTYVTSVTGAKTIGHNASAYNAQNGSGYYGSAIEDENCNWLGTSSKVNGCYQFAQAGVWMTVPTDINASQPSYMIYMSMRTGWENSGFESGWGFPTGNPTFNPDGTMTQGFKNTTTGVVSYHTASSKGIPGSF